MAIITVVGAGVMGTAIAVPAADNGNTVRLVGTHLDTEIIEQCQSRHYHPKLKRHIPESITPYQHTDVAEALDGAEIIVLGVSSPGVKWAADAIGPHLRAGQVIFMVTKGLDNINGQGIAILPDVLRAHLPVAIRDEVYYAAVGGPSIANELAARHHTSVVFASRTAEILPILRNCFHTDYYHVFTSDDLVGVEVCVALKNPYAFAVGLANGLQEVAEPDEANAKMHNFGAAVFAQGLAETAYLVDLLGGDVETVFTLPGAGDLYVTTQGGRNSRFGRLIGMGMAYSDAVEEMPGETVEGVDAIIHMGPTIEAMIASGKLDGDRLPLWRKLYTILTRHEDVVFDFDSFFDGLPFTQPK